MNSNSNTARRAHLKKQGKLRGECKLRRRGFSPKAYTVMRGGQTLNQKIEKNREENENDNITCLSHLHATKKLSQRGQNQNFQNKNKFQIKKKVGCCCAHGLDP